MVNEPRAFKADLKTFRVKLPRPTKDDESPEPILQLQLDFDVSQELVRLFTEIARSPGKVCVVTITPGQRSLL